MNIIWRYLFPLLLVFSLAACSHTQRNIRKQFDESSVQYNRLLSSQRFQEAAAFASGELASEFARRAETAKRIRVIDYRIIRVDYDEEGKKAEVKAEIDYYGLSSLSVRTFTDIQKWSYTNENGQEMWRLTSLLPEFP